MPGDDWEGSKSSKEGDRNPNRILTATWNDGVWSWSGESKAGSSTEFTLPDDRMLTAGQEYHWAVEVTTKNGSSQTITDDFQTALPEPKEDNPFTSVTILTPGLEVELNESINANLWATARQIQDRGGEVLRYQPITSQWQSVTYNPSVRDWVVNDNQQQPATGKPLVLLADWINGIEPVKLLNGGFAEAAADAMFASLVQLDNGKVGGDNGLYNADGTLIRQQGDIFNSPLHFIGIGQGAVVNTEIIQRLGTYFPNAGGVDANSRDLQMTTVDPHDYDENSPSIFQNILDPEVVVWDNVTYADNYYQTNGTGNTLNGQELSSADWNVNLNSLAGFDSDGPHQTAAAWYAGTADLSPSQIPDDNGQTIYRRLGDLAQGETAWYVPDHTNANFKRDNGTYFDAPWEGIGTGWFNSALGGGSELRPYYFDDVEGGKLSKNEIQELSYPNDGWKEYLDSKRKSVKEDNNSIPAMRGDYAVPTLFNGNFDSVTTPLSSQYIPGWSLYNGENNNISQNHLVKWEDIQTLGQYRQDVGYNSFQTNYALKLGDGATEIVHNPFMAPDWGDLRFDVHAPNQSGKLQVTLETIAGELLDEITVDLSADANADNLQTREAKQDVNKVRETYLKNRYKIGLGRDGFETFQFGWQEDDDFPLLQGKPVVLKLALEENASAPVYLDNIFFQSQHLKWGNPTQARWSSKVPAESDYRTNLLLEKPQFVSSYNAETNLPNWVSWQVNKFWSKRFPARFGEQFIADPDLPGSANFPSWPQIDGRIYRGTGLDKGHLIPARDRSKHVKDDLATFLGTNLIPQAIDNNRLFPNSQGTINVNISPAWSRIESKLIPQLVFDYNKELYITAGVFDPDPNNWFDLDSEPKTRSPEMIDKNPGNINTQAVENNGVRIPGWTWKTILVADRPGSGAEKPLGSYTYMTPNIPEPYLNWDGQQIEHPFNNLLGSNRAPITSAQQWREPRTWRLSISQLENLLNGQEINLNFDFLSNITDEETRNNLKSQNDFPFPPN